MIRARAKAWYYWKRCNKDPQWYQILVLLGIARSPSFELYFNHYWSLFH